MFQRVDSGRAAESGVKVADLISLLGAAWCNKSRSQRNDVDLEDPDFVLE